MSQFLSKCAMTLILGIFLGTTILSARPIERHIGLFPDCLSEPASFASIEGNPIVEIVVGAFSGSVDMSWSDFTNNWYTVEVTDLTAFTVIANFSTASTSATITGLTQGHLYRYSVTDGIDIIIEDIVH